MPRVVHFEIHAVEPQRCMGFYQALFGWSFSQFGAESYWMVTTGPDTAPGINGGIVPRRGPVDGQAVIAYVCTVDVDDLDVRCARAGALGGQVVVPKMAIPGVGWLAYAKDTEGNIFGMLQADAAAR